MRSILLAALFAASVTAASAVQPAAPAAPSTAAYDLTGQFRSLALPIANLRVYEIGGIVLIRGTAADRASAEQAGLLAETLGYKRVANLVQVAEPAADVTIERIAEQRLLEDTALEGCKFHISSDRGVVRVTGKVAEDIQKSEVVMLVRTIAGVRDVQTNLTK